MSRMRLLIEVSEEVADFLERAVSRSRDLLALRQGGAMSRPIYWPGLAYFIGMAVAVSGFPVAYVVMAIRFGAWFAWWPPL
jgi:hypothetical protein